MEALLGILSAGLPIARPLLVEATVEDTVGVTASSLLLLTSAPCFALAGRAASPRLTSNHVCACPRSASGVLAQLVISAALSCWVVGVEPDSTETSIACRNAGLS